MRGFRPLASPLTDDGAAEGSLTSAE